MHPGDTPTAPALVTGGAVAFPRAEPELTREQIDLLKRTIAKGTTDDEFRLFLEACRRRRFDPFSKLIYPVKRYDSKERREVMALQSSIDSFRLVAERTGKYAGQVGPFWCGKDGKWVDVWLAEEAPAASKVGVLRSDFKEPLWGVALWSNYVQTTKDGSVTSFWNRMGPLMLAKCAESVALRRAFPEDLAGLYTSDEMAQATNEAPLTTLGQVAQEAATRTQPKEAPRAVKAEIVQPAAKPATKQAQDDPRPADTQGDIPAFTEPVGPDAFGCYHVSFPALEAYDLPVPKDTFDSMGKWAKVKIKSKNAYVDGKAWGWMMEGGPAPTGGRENWLIVVVRNAAEVKATTGLGDVHRYAITTLWHRLKKRAQELADSNADAQRDWDEATKDEPIDAGAPWTADR